MNYGLDWVICGAETGPGARLMNPEWARSVRDQCREAGVAFWMKKMSGGKQPPEDLLILSSRRCELTVGIEKPFSWRHEIGETLYDLP